MIALDVPTIARMRNCFEGGKDNYSEDRDLAECILEICPEFRQTATARKHFGLHALALLAQQGADQFLVFDAGYAPGAHTEVQRVCPQARIFYTDNDPVVLAHGRALYSYTTPEGCVEWGAGTLPHWRTTLADAQRCGALDLTHPVVVSLVGATEYMDPDVNAVQLVHELIAALPAGSVLVLCQAVHDFAAPLGRDVQWRFAQIPIPWTPRGVDEFAEFFDGMEMLFDGVLPPHQWCVPHSMDMTFNATLGSLAGVGVKP